MSDIAIKVENLSKRYRIGLEEEVPDTMASAFLNFLKQPGRNLRQLRRLTRFGDNGQEPEDIIWALKDVSFEVQRGEVVGVIGRNGAGKSTLLKILSRITHPTSGRVELSGRVSSLLEVGTGFHPELTGRENIYLNGTILGMRKVEIDHKFDEIVDFSGVEKFIDTPVKRYSSGMRVRLAFSVAAYLDPEVLLIDEVLAVGDVAFQKKCLGKMGEVARGGRTVLFVSHQMDMIRALCERTVFLRDGQIEADGLSEFVIDEYLNSFAFKNHKSAFSIREDLKLPIQILSGKIMDNSGQERDQFDVFEEIIIVLNYVIREPIEGAIVNFELKRNETTLFFSFDTDEIVENLNSRRPGKYTSYIRLPVPLLKSGRYSVTPGTGIANSGKIQHLEKALTFDVDLHSRPSTYLSYAAKRPGVVAVPIEWKTERETVHMLDRGSSGT